MRRRTALNYYVLAVNLVAVGLLVWIVQAFSVTPLHVALIPVLALSVVLICGELSPIRISHGDGRVDQVTISSSFSLALVVVGPLAIAVMVQTAATLVDDIRQRKPLQKILFNLSQYVVTLVVSRLVYAALASRGVLQDAAPLRRSDIVAALTAAAVFFVVNHVITATVVALSVGDSPLRRLPVDLRYHLSTSGVLLALGPVLVIAVDFSVWTLPLLLMPITAVHKSASLAIQREVASLHDSLTGLPNRVMFRQSVGTSLSSVTGAAPRAALMFVDLDYFKEINDTLGHHVGDRVIEETAARIASAVGPDTMVARLGGDEFALLATTEDGSDPAVAAQAILAALNPPFLIEGVRVDMGASIGIALSPEHGQDVDTLLRCADVALYSAKEVRNAVRVYSAVDDQNTVRRLALLGGLRDALGTDQISVRYQPKSDALTGAIVGVEVLARWEHPEFGLVMPDEFIALAEHGGLMGMLTDRVLDQALKQLRTWRAVVPNLTVAVNVSPRQLSDHEFPRVVSSVLRRIGVPASGLTLEITESGTMGTSARVEAVLRELRGLGVDLSIDDFGIGATSLSYLGRLPLSEMKIDKYFVLGLADATNHAIVRSMIELGHNLGLKVVAEGVESLESWLALSRIDCDVVQGFYVAPPLSAHEMSLLLETRAVAPVAMSGPASLTTVGVLAGRPDTACA